MILIDAIHKSTFIWAYETGGMYYGKDIDLEKILITDLSDTDDPCDFRVHRHTAAGS